MDESDFYRINLFIGHINLFNCLIKIDCVTGNPIHLNTHIRHIPRAPFAGSGCRPAPCGA